MSAHLKSIASDVWKVVSWPIFSKTRNNRLFWVGLMGLATVINTIKIDGPDTSQDELKLGIVDNDLGAVGYALLGDKVVRVVLLGFLLLIPGSFGLFGCIENDNRQTKIRGGLLAFVCLPAAAFLV